VRIERVALEDHGHLAHPRWEPVDDGATDEHLTLGRLFEPGDRAQQRCLAAAGRAEQHEVFAFLRGEVYTVDGVQMATGVLLLQVSDFDR
jgi:hypothetical protein